MSAVVERGVAQRSEALRRANEVRAKRTELKRDIKAGRVSVYALLSDPPECIETMKVSDLLLVAPKYGPVRVTTILRREGVSASKTIGGLTPRQRAALAAWGEGTTA